MDIPNKLLSSIPKKILYEEYFYKAAIKCKKCILHKTRKNVVVGNGNIDAKLMLIGEAAGEEEDIKGIPFIGKAGKQLDKILEYVKLDRNYNLYITNSILCKPPNNRHPLFNEEIMACNTRLLCQIYIIKPKIIVALGRAALQALLQREKIEETISELFAKDDLSLTIDDLSVKIIPTYHPSYLLRKPKAKKEAAKHWEYIKKKFNEVNN